MPVSPPQFTGTKLASALLPPADFPDFTVIPASVYNTGSGIGYDMTYYLDLMSCATYAKVFGDPGFGEDALAEDQLRNGSGQGFGQQILQFTGSAGAVDYLANTKQLIARCPTFNATLQAGTTSHLVMQVSTAQPVEGHEAIMTTTSSGTDGRSDQIFVADGAEVCMVSAMSNGALPQSPSLRSLAAKLVSKVSALH